MDIEYKCQYCRKICKNENSLRNHERLCKLNPNHQEHTGFNYGWTKGLSKETNEGLRHISESLKKHYYKEFVPYHCENCGKLVEEKYGSGKFCSKKCASHRNHTEETKRKTSETLKKRYNIILEKQCVICGNIFQVNKLVSGRRSHSTTCSEECHKKLVSLNSKRSMNKLITEGKHKGWMTRNITSYAERFFKKVLENNNIEYEFNKPICKNDLGVDENGNYFLDFALNNKIDLEIDGKQHKLEERHQHDLIRDERLIKNGWKVYRIEWKSLQKYKDYMKKEIDKFLKWYEENKNSRSGC